MRADWRGRSQRGGIGRRAVVSMLGSLAATGIARTPANAQDPLLDIYKPALPGGRLRTYYIAAEEVDWNYAPLGRDEAMGHAFMDEHRIWVSRSPTTIGLVYRKALLFEYTDDTFSARKPRPPEWQHLGLLGPVIRAEVGDVIRVIFKNGAGRPYSLHPHGVFYRKADEGSPYNDGTSGAEKRDDQVKPGDKQIYVWQVPERAGPGPRDPNSLLWLYHSHINEPRDTNAGLIGAIIVTARGQALADGRPRSVDREFVTLWKIFDENQSWLIEPNAAAANIDPDALRKDRNAYREFFEGNRKYSVNGFILGNMPMPVMTVGERVRWYVAALGTGADLHTPHWHGGTLLVGGRRKDVVGVLPAETLVGDMIPDGAGIWMLHCHVDDHHAAGMMARYQVLPKAGSRKR